mmetsp:Transcript_91084/g.273542  ORF Transcript_91084/g.273542 Transcript_91084/m.273542 type:complete len:251 (+) Transcript_91084:1657-2409(+)
MRIKFSANTRLLTRRRDWSIGSLRASHCQRAQKQGSREATAVGGGCNVDVQRFAPGRNLDHAYRSQLGSRVGEPAGAGETGMEPQDAVRMEARSAMAVAVAPLAAGLVVPVEEVVGLVAEAEPAVVQVGMGAGKESIRSPPLPREAGRPTPSAKLLLTPPSRCCKGRQLREHRPNMSSDCGHLCLLIVVTRRTVNSSRNTSITACHRQPGVQVLWPLRLGTMWVRAPSDSVRPYELQDPTWAELHCGGCR